jgi:hypothetical protein
MQRTPHGGKIGLYPRDPGGFDLGELQGRWNMTRSVLRSAIFPNILIVTCCLLAFLFVQTPVALAQHGGGHVGGSHGGGGVGGAHVAPPPAHGASAPRPLAPAPPIGHFGAAPGTGALLRYRGRPIRPLPPPPVYPFYGYPFFFGGPFYYGFGPGWGFNSCWWWANCDLYWLWGYGSNSWSPYSYGYGSGYDGYASGNYIGAAPSTPTYAYPVTYGGDRADLPKLYLKDGTVYTVTDYWVVDDELHFTVREEGKMVEHNIAFDDLDLQRTIDMAKHRGFLFVLRDEPVEQYMKDHPEPAAPPDND